MPKNKLTYFEVLGLEESCSTAEVVRSFRRKSLKAHPDKPTGDKILFQQLNQAYSCLKDDARRQRYLRDGFDDQNVSTEDTDSFVDAFFGEGARASDGHSADWKLTSINNYQFVNLNPKEVDEEQLPIHMKDIIKVGLNYLASLPDQDFSAIFFMRHLRIDILYLMIGLCDGSEVLTQDAFEGEATYPITYYDTPLQPGISPRWSDQNVLNSAAKIKDMNEKRASGQVERRELSFEEFERRQRYALAALEYKVDELGVLENKYEQGMLKNYDERRKVDMYQEDVEADYK
mmetsp:Transcript_18731/g.46829  ORF Transcript_18731/g.46829 Transcript_18731/m.46829 type:complete len:289 (+) Transcript_18731:263-1129(+)|eukprot:g15703.t1